MTNFLKVVKPIILIAVCFLSACNSDYEIIDDNYSFDHAIYLKDGNETIQQFNKSYVIFRKGDPVLSYFLTTGDLSLVWEEEQNAFEVKGKGAICCISMTNQEFSSKLDHNKREPGYDISFELDWKDVGGCRHTILYSNYNNNEGDTPLYISSTGFQNTPEISPDFVISGRNCRISDEYADKRYVYLNGNHPSAGSVRIQFCRLVKQGYYITNGEAIPLHTKD